MKKRSLGIAAAAFIAAACLLLYGYRAMQPDRPAVIAGTWLSEETQGRTKYFTTVQFNQSGSGHKVVRTKRPARGGGAVEEVSGRANIIWGIRKNIFYIDGGPWLWKLSDDQRVLELSNPPPFNYKWTLNRQ